jgi:N-acetyl-gamma-glutamyl-phosphate reductase
LIKAGVIGASGYTGAELLRIISLHPQMDMVLATANQYAGEPISSLYPSLANAYTGSFQKLDTGSAVEACDVLFLGLPHGESMKLLPELASAGKKTVDLSADFRFDDADEYRKWYGTDHRAPEMLEQVVYGLPEMKRDEIREAQVVANPGCYSTGALLGLFPAVEAGLVGGTVIIDAKSGVSGAGRQLTLGTHYPQVADSLEPYAVSGHRHLPEIVGELTKIARGAMSNVVFTPHLVAMNRGLLCTIYIPLAEKIDVSQARSIYEETFADEKFVHLLPSGSYPQTKAVQGSNSCHLSLEVPPDANLIIVMTAIDNLVKGASGEAVQNMNLMCGLPEEMGLESPGLFP